MSVVTAASINPVAGPRLAVESLLGALLWLTGFAGAFVFIEPSPYEFVAVLTIFLFVLTGLSLRAELAPLALVLVLTNIGYAIAVLPVSDQTKPVIWVLVSIFLAATAIFYAAMLGSNTQRRIELLMCGYLAAAIVASLVAAAAYFRLFGGASDMFMLYGRARGTFNDPNVLGAFLVLPALLVFQRMMAGRLVVRSALMLLILLMALFLTFSRGAWAQIAFAGTMLMAVTFVTSRSVNERSRIVLVAVGGILAMAALVTALLSIGQVSDLFNERASFELELRSRTLRPLRALRAGRGDGARPSARDRTPAILPVFHRGPPQHLSQHIHVRRLARRFRLPDAFRGDAGGEHALSFRAHALATGLSGDPCRLCRRRRRERHHRHRPLATLFSHSGRAVGIDGGVPALAWR